MIFILAILVYITAIESLTKTDNMVGEALDSKRLSICEKLRTLKYQQQQQNRTERKTKQHSHDDEKWEL